MAYLNKVMLLGRLTESVIDDEHPAVFKGDKYTFLIMPLVGD